ncbi:hypothetical protein AHF37_11702 [Paragonimus kellicotti]|nr:hypothetical protein AHF37_11702 [Paragonimus kellicotti]
MLPVNKSGQNYRDKNATHIMDLSVTA